MKLRLGADEFVQYYLSPEDDGLGGNVMITLRARDYANYKRVQEEFDTWQRRLAGLMTEHRNK